MHLYLSYKGVLTGRVPVNLSMGNSKGYHLGANRDVYS